MSIFCTGFPADIKFEMYMEPQSMSALTMALGSKANEWFYLMLVWPVGSPLKFYEDGKFVTNGNWQTGILYSSEENTKRNLAFGIEFLDLLSIGHGKAYVDGVRIFNRPLTSDEVEALYLSYGNNEMTTDFVTTTELMNDNHIDISSNVTELNMETISYTGNAVLSTEFKNVRLLYYFLLLVVSCSDIAGYD